MELRANQVVRSKRVPSRRCRVIGGRAVTTVRRNGTKVQERRRVTDNVRCGSGGLPKGWCPCFLFQSKFVLCNGGASAASAKESAQGHGLRGL